jgi:cytidylate kinase
MTKSSVQHRFITVAIDGGAASGKSSTARLLAKRLGWLHVDTGSHYRAITLAACRAGLAAEDPGAVAAFMNTIDLDAVVRHGQSWITIQGREPDPEALRSQLVNEQVSNFAALACVRGKVGDYQRAQVRMAQAHQFDGLVMEGRDIGTVILPDADIKIFLEADPETRQSRRAREGGTETIAARDRIDSSRAVAPLTKAADAVVIDNSSMPLEAVVEAIVQLVDEKRAD